MAHSTVHRVVKGAIARNDSKSNLTQSRVSRDVARHAHGVHTIRIRRVQSLYLTTGPEPKGLALTWVGRCFNFNVWRFGSGRRLKGPTPSSA